MWFWELCFKKPSRDCQGAFTGWEQGSIGQASQTPKNACSRARLGFPNHSEVTCSEKKPDVVAVQEQDLYNCPSKDHKTLQLIADLKSL